MTHSTVTHAEALHKCAVCHDTGSKSTWAGGDLDCSACNAAVERAMLDVAIEAEKKRLTEEYRLSEFSPSWFAYQAGKALGAAQGTAEGVLRDGVKLDMEPVTYMIRYPGCFSGPTESCYGTALSKAMQGSPGTAVVELYTAEQIKDAVRLIDNGF